MARKLSKSQKAKLRDKRSKTKVKKMERQDSLGISRKPLKDALNPKIFIILKIISIVLVPLSYLLFSPALIFCMVFSVLMAIFATMAERHMNHTFIKSNHIRIWKFDSIFAVLVIIITISGAAMFSDSKKHRTFAHRQSELVRQIENVGSCLTGQRSVIRLGGFGIKFGMKDFPTDMPSLPPKNGGERPKIEMKLEDLPIEAVFSQMISSMNTVLVFIVPLSGAVTLLLFYKNKKKFDKEMNELVTDEIPSLSDEELESIFMFGLIENQEESIENENEAKK